MVRAGYGRTRLNVLCFVSGILAGTELETGHSFVGSLLVCILRFKICQGAVLSDPLKVKEALPAVSRVLHLVCLELCKLLRMSDPITVRSATGQTLPLRLFSTPLQVHLSSA